ncbi:hypothetical protein EJB05_39589, partial [Eragrostis curvula]
MHDGVGVDKQRGDVRVQRAFLLRRARVQLPGRDGHALHLVRLRRHAYQVFEDTRACGDFGGRSIHIDC